MAEATLEERVKALEDQIARLTTSWQEVVVDINNDFSSVQDRLSAITDDFRRHGHLDGEVVRRLP